MRGSLRRRRGSDRGGDHRHREDRGAGGGRTPDVVTTGTFAPMWPSGAFINLTFRPAHQGVAGVVQSGAGLQGSRRWTATWEPPSRRGRPLNKVYPGEFNYGGGHVIRPGGRQAGPPRRRGLRNRLLPQSPGGERGDPAHRCLRRHSATPATGTRITTAR
jgi:hypothetical protein